MQLLLSRENMALGASAHSPCFLESDNSLCFQGEHSKVVCPAYNSAQRRDLGLGSQTLGRWKLEAFQVERLLSMYKTLCSVPSTTGQKRTIHG